jgi:anaerobic magnesium-protoporphyrin IX monomethyl ester cyclase
MNILLTHGYFLHDDPAEQRVMKPYVPLGILSLAAYLDSRGFTTQVFDSTFATLARFEAELTRVRPGVVGIYVNMMTKFSAIRMIATAKDLGAKVIVGGPEPAFYSEEFLRSGADVVVIGEAELTLAELLPALDGGVETLRQIAGITFLDGDGAVVRTPPRALLPDIDQLPFPDRNKVALLPYLDAWRSRHGYASLSLITMRGCPFTCTWCSHGVYGESYRRRSPRLVADEIEWLLAGHRPDALWFADDVFTISHRWLFGLEDEVRRRNLRFRYECITRADRMNEDVVRSLAATGCSRLWIGSESGSQRILDAMSRRVQVEQVQEMTRLAQRHGIEVGMFIMLGYTGETRADIEATVRHVRASRPDVVLTTLAYPIKGTRFYSENQDALVLPSLPFREWNDRMIEITGRYSKRFYWFANRRIVNEAALSRMSHQDQKNWSSLAGSFLKAKVAQLFMSLIR